MSALSLSPLDRDGKCGISAAFSLSPSPLLPVVEARVRPCVSCPDFSQGTGKTQASDCLSPLSLLSLSPLSPQLLRGCQRPARVTDHLALLRNSSCRMCCGRKAEDYLTNLASLAGCTLAALYYTHLSRRLTSSDAFKSSVAAAAFCRPLF